MKPKLSLSNKAKTTRAGTVVGIKSFNDALNTQKRAVQRLKSVKNLSQKEEKNPQLSRLQSKVDKSVQDLYKQYISSDFDSMKEKVLLADKLLHSLKVNNKCVKKANMITFFFINFYKDFEQNIIKGNCWLVIV